MLLLGALLTLFVAGFWLYCLVDVTLTPSNECRGLPKAGWIVIVAGTFVVGAVVWLAVRRPATPTMAALTGGPGAPGAPGAPEAPGAPGPEANGGRDQRQHDQRRPDQRRDQPDRGAQGNEPPGPVEEERGPSGNFGPVPGGRGAGPARAAAPVGPDDDPEFLRSLDRAISGAGDDPGG